MHSNSTKPFSYETFPASGQVAYFSMEIAIHPSMPTYSGGLGVLAGDTLRSAADLGVPLAAFTLLHRKGYFQQHIDQNGQQTEEVQAVEPRRLLHGGGRAHQRFHRRSRCARYAPGAMTWSGARGTLCPSTCSIPIWTATPAGIAG